MSADNGIYILITTDKFVKVDDHITANNGKPVEAYRVAHVQAIDNFDYYKKYEPHNLGTYMYKTWGDGDVFYEKTKALVKAQELYDDFSFVEYGIAEIDAREFNFYGY